MRDSIYQTPKTELNNTLDSLNLASRRSRLGAILIDSLLILPIAVAIIYALFDLEPIIQGLQPPYMVNLAAVVTTLAIFVVLNYHLLTTKGQTIGKKLMGIRIVTITGEPANNIALIKRYCFYYGVPHIPIAGGLISMVNVFFIFGSTKRCLHDRFANTAVVCAE